MKKQNPLIFTLCSIIVLLAHLLLMIFPLLKAPNKELEIRNMGQLKIRSLQLDEQKYSAKPVKKQQQSKQQVSPKHQELAKKMADILNDNAKLYRTLKTAQQNQSFSSAAHYHSVPPQVKQVAKGLPLNTQRFLTESDFFVDLESAPKKFDELNEKEKVLYSFISRAILTYFNSLIDNLEDYRQRHPYLSDFPFISEKREVRLRARVIFDKLGNIVSIKMLRWAEDNHLQNYFIESLEKMGQLPNPPKMIIDENSQEFVFVYGLNIKS